MTSDQRRCRAIRLLRPVVLAAGVCVAAGGCGIVPSCEPGPIDSLRAFAPATGPKTQSKAFKQKVENDPFPTAGKAGA